MVRDLSEDSVLWVPETEFSRFALDLDKREQHMADLKVFWGAEFCRLEYLLHLLDTGRIKGPYWVRDAS
ncbi:MAG: hypothetical protein ACR2JC_19835 [Chloroflexota bacterium]